MEGKVQIHGKTYLTVAYRVNELRKDHPDWAISTEIIENTENRVVMKAIVAYPEGACLITIGVGHAEEFRASSQINKTSALENCETSAIGRALAACGYGGTEYASANEVETAIHQQREPISDDPIDTERCEGAYKAFKEVIDADVDVMDFKRVQIGYERLTNDERIYVQDMFGSDKPEGCKKGYKAIIKELLKMKESDDGI